MKFPTIHRDAMTVPSALAWACIVCGTSFSFLANYGAAAAAGRGAADAGGYFGAVEFAVYLWPTASFTLTTATLKWFVGSPAMSHLVRWGWAGRVALLGLFGGVVAVATPAGIQSFDHMTSLAEGAGIDPGSSWMLPVSADGAIVLGSIALLVVGVVRELIRAKDEAERAAAERRAVEVAEAERRAAEAERARLEIDTRPAIEAPEPTPRPKRRSARAKAKRPAADVSQLDAAKAVLRAEPDLSVRAAAEKAGVSRATVSNAKRALEAEGGRPEPDGSPATNGHHPPTEPAPDLATTGRSN